MYRPNDRRRGREPAQTAGLARTHMQERVPMFVPSSRLSSEQLDQGEQGQNTSKGASCTVRLYAVMPRERKLFSDGQLFAWNLRIGHTYHLPEIPRR